MELSIEKYAILIMKNGKRQIMEEIELPNQEKIRTLGKKENYKSSGSGHHQTIRDERKDEKRVL